MTDIKVLKDSNVVLTELLEKVLARQDEINQQQTAILETLHSFVGSDQASI